MLDTQLICMALLGLVQLYIGYKMYQKVSYPGIIAFIIAGGMILISSLVSMTGLVPLLRHLMIGITLTITIGLWYLWKAVEKL